MTRKTSQKSKSSSFTMLETKIDVGKTALLVIDMQNGFVRSSERPWDELTKVVESTGVIKNIAKVIAAARQVNMPVIFIRLVHLKDRADVVPTITDEMLLGRVHPTSKSRLVEGTVDAEFVDELKPAMGDPVICKRKPNAFYQTDLELILRSLGIDTVIITGVITDGCVANTARGARERDFHIIVLSDCCVSVEPEDHEYFIKKVFPRRGCGRVRTSDDIIAAMVEANP